MARGPGPRILVVDSDEEFRRFVSTLLAEAGHRPLGMSTGQGALRSAQRSRPSLVLLDVALTDVSGYEVCHALRESFGQLLPIMFVTGTRTEAYDRVSGLLVGADDYLVKPFAPDELLARVRRLLIRSQHAGDRRPFDDLTKRELEVLTLLAEGRRQVEIARELDITDKTVATHIQHVLEKLGVHSRAEAVSFAHTHGLPQAF